ncbi:MAG: bifunctional glutamate N-acetyltransferase/amino-acid acetyltransferase ArgJ [Planctomycetes bacterium]|nr:bifunctional glutamate N-acetyltransferase/amino-acid acetyltransferase ArgJ [Planctomycetota bacterium]MCB9916943.1 bifunctional glutamate N-acetyltransferase/amino-acid acetyltransferase ArgJ [Planctomycetota bacterium]
MRSDPLEHEQDDTQAARPTPPNGFRFSSTDAGLAKGARLDLWLAVADDAYPAAAVFTTNRVVASPVAMSREHLRLTGGRVRAILVNAGCANACTGQGGDEDAATCARWVAELVQCDPREVLVFSTGVIGKRLNMPAIERSLPGLYESLAATPDALEHASRAILTTDLVPKVSSRRIPLRDGAFGSMVGLAKGSGMIHPQMATMLGFVFTDLMLGDSTAIALRSAVQQSFHRIDVDGDTSTNDSVLAWSSGRRSEKPLDFDDTAHAGLVALTDISIDLAKRIARDGEGATRLIEVRVRGAASDHDADLCARAIATSMLVRTAVHGNDPNWGRIVAAVGRSGADLDTRRLRVGIGDACLFEDDTPHPDREPTAAAALRLDPVVLWAELGRGACESVYYTCDLSADYVRINANYRS